MDGSNNLLERLAGWAGVRAVMMGTDRWYSLETYHTHNVQNALIRCGGLEEETAADMEDSSACPRGSGEGGFWGVGQCKRGHLSRCQWDPQEEMPKGLGGTQRGPGSTRQGHDSSGQEWWWAWRPVRSPREREQQEPKSKLGKRLTGVVYWKLHSP